MTDIQKLKSKRFGYDYAPLYDRDCLPTVNLCMDLINKINEAGHASRLLGSSFDRDGFLKEMAHEVVDGTEYPESALRDMSRLFGWLHDFTLESAGGMAGFAAALDPEISRLYLATGRFDLQAGGE